MPASVFCFVLYLPLKYKNSNVWSFCHSKFNPKQLDGFVGQQEDIVATHPKPTNQSPHAMRLGLLLGNVM